MPINIFRGFGFFRINDINSVLGFFPGVDDAVARINAAGALVARDGHAGVVHHHIAGFREAHARDQMTVVPAAGAIAHDV